jgi:hypothetical protein
VSPPIAKNPAATRFVKSGIRRVFAIMAEL